LFSLKKKPKPFHFAPLAYFSTKNRSPAPTKLPFAKENNDPNAKIPLPRRVGVLGKGAIGSCITDMLLETHPDINLVALDMVSMEKKDPRFEFIHHKVTKDNLKDLLKLMRLKEGDILLDLSSDIDCTQVWDLCMRNNIMYFNTAMEEWPDSDNLITFPKNKQEMYNSSLGKTIDDLRKDTRWNESHGLTTLLLMGANPGLISHFTKRGLLDASQYFLTRKDWTDLDHDAIARYAASRDYPKLA